MTRKGSQAAQNRPLAASYALRALGYRGRGAKLAVVPVRAPVDPARTARLEHTSGLVPLGSDPDHCHECWARVEERELQAACQHEATVEVTSGVSWWPIARFCADCNVRLPRV